MKFSVVTDMLGKESFEEAVQHAKQLNFDYVDLRAMLDGDTIDTISIDKAKKLHQLIRKYDLKVSTLSSWAVNPCTFSGEPKYNNKDENHHQKMRQVLDRLLDLADAFDATYIRIYPLHRNEGFDQLSENEKELEYKYNAQILKGHAEHAQKRGKVLLVENEPPTLANTVGELAKIMEYADHPNLKVNWDIVNGWRAGEYPTLQQYEKIKGNVHQVHIKGASRVINSSTNDNPHGLFNNFTIAGQDDFDHEEIMKALLAGDPHVILTIDTHYPSFYQQDKIGEVEVIERTKEFFEKTLA
ncbi:sugar phosphate isomerase/epimerase [Jeotgalibacillus sp. S-D1]|uniref:sugar phosphate isomerase/epimerase family protein n=1 Tax=Jeotgalibacillus sp. S-D1 TaxID=2552189 RepID=UPI0014055BF7|nr:sugar phosphate isomerase/epimerase [Jeotgalibacillus sp. S-D1]